MADNDYKRYEPIDGKWRITRELGRGAYGTVFEIERKDFSNMKSALKVISIPNNENELRSYREDNYDLDEQSVTSYFYGFVEEFIKEFQIMSKLRGHSNIVSYEDHDVVKRSEGIGWDIFIRMELLTPMNQYFSQHAPNSQDVIKLGIDICKALEVCRNHNIIHRDIKPSNIFMSDIGDFKLGDFGVARTLEKTSGGLSQKGTYTYMAPEIYKGQEYNASVDIYSLGIVMYRLLNNNMEPFRTDRTFANGESAMARRMTGEPIPRPANAGDELARIIMKACAYSPQDRYSNAKDMRSDLERLLKRKKSSVFIGINPVNTGYTNPNLNPNTNPNLNREEKNTKQKKEKRTNTSGNNKGKKGIRVTICILCIIAVIAGIGIAAYKIIGSHTDGEENSHIENKIVSDDIELELEDGSKKAILDVLSLESEADINAESSNTDVVQIVNEDGEIYILCSDVGSAEITYEYSADTSKKETNIYSGTIKVTVVMSEKEKKEVEEGQAELDTLLSEANAVLEKAQNDNTVNHDHFTNEENELTSAINNFKEKAESTERSDDVKAAKQYYTDTVQPAVDNMNTAYNTAVQIAADEAAAKSAAANSAAGKSSSSGNASSASGNKSSSKSSGGTSSNRSTNTQSGRSSSGSASSGGSSSGSTSSGRSSSGGTSSGGSSSGSTSSGSSGGSTSSGSSSGGSSASHGSQYGEGGQYD
ncbi:MAG: serine/threonine protein kinase [Oscillospiraceae bacterium]|nr:serine/threonine protein kinase [Oscillospiraceae bacterium]